MDPLSNSPRARWDIFHRIGFRFAWVAAVSVVVAFLLFGILAYPPIKRLLLERETQAMEAQLSLAVEGLSHSLASLRGTLQHPVTTDLARELIVASTSNAPEAETLHHQLQSLFSRLMEDRPALLQMRVIGPVPEGREMVSVARIGASIQLTKPENLKAQGLEDSYNSAMRLERGQLLVTQVDFNQTDRDSSGDLPPPTMCAFSPLFLRGEETPIGVLSVSLSANALLERIQRSLTFGGDVLFFDLTQDQALLVEAQGSGAVFLPLDSKRDPGLAAVLQRVRNHGVGNHIRPIEQENGFLYGARHIRLDWSSPERNFLIVSRSSDEAVMRAVMASVQILWLSGVSFALMAALVAGVWGAAMARPISDVARAIDRFAQGGSDVDLPENTHGEIGTLIASVRRMRQLVDERTDHLKAQIERSQQLESERMLFHERLIQSQKLEAIGSMAGGLAHDFNNLLTAVFGFAGLLAHSKNLDATEREWLEHILAAARRGRDLIRRVLTFSRQGGIERRQIHLATVLHESVKLLRASVPSSIRLDVEVHTDEFIVGDETQLSQVILNLGTNAAHAVAPTHGEIAFKLDAMRVDDQFCLSHPELSPGRHLIITVSDNGEGISRERQQRIFEPFFTTKPVGEGTGLGLAVVHGIVRAHQGAITVSSDEGRGATFRVYLPIQTTPCDVVAPESDTEGPLPRFTGKIMVVDDEESICFVLSRILMAHGYTVETRSNGIEALASFLEDPYAYSLVITDQTMPEMTGDQLILALRQRSDSIPVILTSGYSTTLTPRRLDELGINEVLVKPFSEKGLLRALRRIEP